MKATIPFLIKLTAAILLRPTFCILFQMKKRNTITQLTILLV